MYNFVMPAEEWDEMNPNKQAIRHLILKHRSGYERLNKLKRYYEGNYCNLSSSERKYLCGSR